MRPIYPYRVYVSRPEPLMSEAERAHVDGTKTCCGRDSPQASHDHRHHHGAAGGGQVTARDPVCGMSVDPATSKHHLDHDGQTFYFCSAGCQAKFVTDPKKYLETSRPQAEPFHADMPEGTIYTCPMHPEIRQVGPGSCPICGMALEPEVASLDAGPNPELADMTQRFWIGAALSIPPVVLEMGGHLVGSHGWVDQTLSNWIQLV